MRWWGRRVAMGLVLAVAGFVAAGWGDLPPAPVPALRVTPEPTRVVADAPVRAGVPVEIAMPGHGYASAVPTMEVADAGAINPPDFRHTFFIADKGTAPSSRAPDTTYFACHTSASRSAWAVPCNRLPGAVAAGDEVVVRTTTETLRYRVTTAYRVPRAEFEDDPRVWDVNPGRLVWVTCYLADGRRTDYNFVIIAELVR